MFLPIFRAGARMATPAPHLVALGWRWIGKLITRYSNKLRARLSSPFKTWNLDVDEQRAAACTEPKALAAPA